MLEICLFSLSARVLFLCVFGFVVGWKHHYKQPSLVLADEPTANLDSSTSNEILALMAEMQKRYKTTFIFVTHDTEIMYMADEIFILSDGQLTKQEEREDVK